MFSPDKNKMRRDTLFALGTVCFFFWLGITYFLFLQKPNSQNPSSSELQYNKNLELKIDNLNRQLKEQVKTNSLLLSKLKQLKNKDADSYVDVNNLIDLLDDPNIDINQVLRPKLVDKIKPKAPSLPSESDTSINTVKKESNEDEKNEESEEAVSESEDPDDDGDIVINNKDLQTPEKPVIPVLVFSCNRVTVNRALDLLLTYRPSKAQFPIIVTQDCGHKETKEVIEGYGDQIIYIQQPDLSDPVVPPKEKKFKGYFKIARHYGWALNQTFTEMGYDQVVIVEDDLEISPDFFEYFTATLPVLRADKSLWCVSAWNDNGKTGLIDEATPELLYRTDFFPGLGWMLTKDMWKEIMVKWPRSYWDDWMREPQHRKGRSCIRPEVSRTKTFGKIGVSNGLFYEKHLKYIVLNKQFVPFTVMDLSFLKKDNYDESFVKVVYNTPVVSVQDLKSGKVVDKKAVRVTYHTREAYKKTAKALGIMDDFKSGVPRMAYRGIVSFMHSGVRVYLAPNVNWAGYDPKWA
eukprot:GFUD01005776.1.p1 GENE.GFUD01005776.1~~GFUD01005776.1.p1  ORF type:complete len:520 (+),score=120.96 GFUD01005776.1:95-1654(+)